MGLVTLQLIEGLERGQIFEELSTPISIGREEDNSIQLNDERVSRFHVKIQEDGGKVILTDLGSTNGTRVNGHPVQIRVLRPGDQLGIGRCLLIYGSPEEIADRAADLRQQRSLSLSDSTDLKAPQGDDESGLWEPEEAGTLPGSQDSDSFYSDELELFPEGPPELTVDLPPLQQAQMSDYVAYLHDQIRVILESACEDSPAGDHQSSSMKVDWEAWQRLLNVEMSLATYLRKLANPDS